MFGSEINIFSNHKNMVYTATLSESHRAMRWKLIVEEFGPNIQHRVLVDNIVANMISRLLSTSSNKNEPCTRKAQFRVIKLFGIGRKEKIIIVSR